MVKGGQVGAEWDAIKSWANICEATTMASSLMPLCLLS